MTELEIMNQVGTVKVYAVLLWFAWLLISFQTSSRQRGSGERSPGFLNYAGSVFINAVTFVLAAPILLGIQFAIFFQGMSLYEAQQVSGGALFLWGGANLVIGLLLFGGLNLLAEPGPGWAAFFIRVGSIPLVFIAIGMLGLGALFASGMFTPEMLYALKIYSQEFAVNSVFGSMLIFGFICLAWWALT